VKHHLHVSAKAVVVRDGQLLLVEYQDTPRGEVGHHYNLPGGRMLPDEQATETLRRKGVEEAGACLVPGPLLLVYEYIGRNHAFVCEDKHSVSLVFRCDLAPGSEEPSLTRATARDAIQTDVRWIPLDRLEEIVLWPNFACQLVQAIREPQRGNQYWGDIL